MILESVSPSFHLSIQEVVHLDSLPLVVLVEILEEVDETVAEVVVMLVVYEAVVPSDVEAEGKWYHLFLVYWIRVLPLLFC